MKYRFYGNKLQLVKYTLSVIREYNGETQAETLTAVTDQERDRLLKEYPDAVMSEVDNTGYEWLNGMTFTQEQLKSGEFEQIVEMGEEAYNEMINSPSQDEINAMLMLEIAELKAGVLNE